MNGRAYYNENDPAACAAIRELISGGVIAPGDVDSRSIKEVVADDLRGYTQWHFFAGAGCWSVAARLAGWPDERPIVTASCPCQPFSAAGEQRGTDDPRHLWPDLHRILAAAGRSGFCPPVLVGEQVAGKAGRNWFDGVRADLAREQIRARAVDIPACAVDAPHERNRLYWIAVADAQECRGGAGLCESGAQRHGAFAANGDGGNVVLADAEGERGRGDEPQRGSSGRASDGRLDAHGALADADDSFVQGQSPARQLRVYEQDGRACGRHAAHSRNGSWWADAEWITCHDGKSRRAKPEIPMLVDGMAGRIDLWRLAGNSIVPVLAAEVIAAYLEAEAMSA